MLAISAAIEGYHPAIMIPKYSLMGPFRGHMSIKSSPFSPSSSCKLSSQYIIQDHMDTHYRKLLSAKAAVDSSAPKSLNKSIKYRDQQKKERIIKAVEKYKKDMAQIFSAPSVRPLTVSTGHHQNRQNRASSGRMPSLKSREQCSTKHFKKPLSRIQSPVLSSEKTIQDIVQWSLSQARNDGRNTFQHRVLPFTPSHLLPLSCNRKKTFQPQLRKIFNGDLMERHAGCFTETKQPFTPKVLKTSSKSAISKYRYYNPPHRKKGNHLGKQTCKTPIKYCRSLEDECPRNYADDLMRHPVKKQNQTSVSLQSLLQAKEEELKYLRLLKEVTDDVLTRSCYCKETLGDIFQMHIRNRSCDLDEVKMQRIFQALKDDLNICANLPDSSISYAGIEHKSNSLTEPCVFHHHRSNRNGLLKYQTQGL